jgi:cyclophilin family peptidyl-prolyl cis-trans isomerase
MFDDPQKNLGQLQKELLDKEDANKWLDDELAETRRLLDGDETAPAVSEPETVRNFVKYAEEGHYDGTIFHRVIDGFMIQGGGFTKAMNQKPTREPIRNEAMNGLKNERGTIAMARTMIVDSATSQFFINLVDNSFLDFSAPTPQGFGYAVFGKVVDGMSVVDSIAKVKTGFSGPHQNVPEEAIVIKKITIG